MTRKHFQAIASILRDNLHAYPETAEDHAENYRVRAIAADLSSYLRGQNPRFDRDRFLEAAGCLFDADAAEYRIDRSDYWGHEGPGATNIGSAS